MSFRDELIATPPKLTLSSFPTHKALPPTPGALTPPLQPMVSIPFLWEEVPGRPRLNTLLSPYKPKSFRCLELPPRLLQMPPSSPTTVLDGPKVGRTLSHKFFLEDISPNSLTDNCRLGVVDGSGLENGPCRWASDDGTKWDQIVEKPNGEFSNLGVKSRSVRSEVDIEGRMTRFKRKSKASFIKLSHKSTCLLENMYQGLRQMLVRRCKEGGELGTEASTLKISNGVTKHVQRGGWIRTCDQSTQDKGLNVYQ